MQSKLTLRLEQDLIERARQYSALHGKSVSQLVADYFSLLDTVTEPTAPVLTPLVRQLKGALRGAAVDETDYRQYLEEKYR